MKKKFTKLFTVLTLTTVLSVNTLATSFTDVTETHWAYDEITYMQANGYLLKNSAGQFLPNEKITYFDYAELLAKISGYVDANFVTDIDPQLEANIAKMYEQQIPYIQQYDNDEKYKTWNTSSNEEIAYLLAIGYMNTDDLGRFMVKSATGQEAKKVLTKQDLARYLVFYIGKANTAQASYTGITGFADDTLIREENKPYVAYLKANGLASGDANNNYGANTEVTRSLAAYMTVNAIEFKENLVATQQPVPEVEVEPEVEDVPVVDDTSRTLNGVIKNFVPRNDGTGERFLLLEEAGTSNFLVFHEETVIKNSVGNEVEVEAIAVGQNVLVVADEDDRIAQLIILDLTSEKDDAIEEDTEQDTEQEDEDASTTVGIYTGDVQWVGRNGDLTVATEKGSVIFDLSDDCYITDGTDAIAFEKLEIGDKVTIKVEDDEITEIHVTFKQSDEVSGDIVFVSSINKLQNYVFTVKKDEELMELEIPKDVEIERDGDEVNLNELRIGDALSFEKEGNEIVKIEAVSSESVVEGIVKSILISHMPEVVIETEEGDVTVAITTDTEIYDEDTRQDMTIREIYLGSEVEVRTESSEALSFVIESAPTKINYKGTIETIWSGSRSIDVLVEYDGETGEAMVIKTFAVPTETSIQIDGDESHRNDLEEGMEILVSVNYGELYPEQIVVLED